MPSGLKIEARRNGRKELINVITACVDPQVLVIGDSIKYTAKPPSEAFIVRI